MADRGSGNAGHPRGGTAPQGGWMQREQLALGAALTVQLWAEDRARGAAAMAAVLAEMQRLERAFSARRAGSELALINAAGAQGPLLLSAELCALLGRALSFSRLTGGAFDVTVAALAVQQEGRPATAAPDDAGLARARQAVGWRLLQFDPLQSSLRFARPGMRIDLGAFLQGHAVDRGVALLQRLGIAHAIVSVGPHSRVLGDRRGKPWMLAIRDPQHADAALALLPLQDLAASSAAPRRVLDPFSGRPTAGTRSVSVIAPEASTAAALAQAVCVLGPERGLALVEGLADVELVLADAEGRLHLSAGFEPPPAAAEPTMRLRRSA
ncbi:MAG: FAD:protein FMN transferase [Proteobacteria bacterium]|nr:FAD:protein FMN transferase [Pseudomonadota bacterium]